MRYSVTGVSRELTTPERSYVLATIAALDDVEEFTTGCAYGVDTAAHHAAVISHPGTLKRLCVPAAPHNIALVSMAVPSIKNWIVDSPPARRMSHSEAYMERNDRLVAHADVLLAYPETHREEWRGSGTWATIRRARRAGVEVRMHPLDYA